MAGVSQWVSQMQGLVPADSVAHTFLYRLAPTSSAGCRSWVTAVLPWSPRLEHCSAAPAMPTPKRS